MHERIKMIVSTRVSAATLLLTSSPAPGIPKCITPISNAYDGVALVDMTTTHAE